VENWRNPSIQPDEQPKNSLMALLGSIDATLNRERFKKKKRGFHDFISRTWSRRAPRRGGHFLERLGEEKSTKMGTASGIHGFKKTMTLQFSKH